jgi:hypothetical protein
MIDNYESEPECEPIPNIYINNNISKAVGLMCGAYKALQNTNINKLLEPSSVIYCVNTNDLLATQLLQFLITAIYEQEYSNNLHLIQMPVLIDNLTPDKIFEQSSIMIVNALRLLGARNIDTSVNDSDDESNSENDDNLSLEYLLFCYALLKQMPGAVYDDTSRYHSHWCICDI